MLYRRLTRAALNVNVPLKILSVMQILKNVFIFC